MEPWVEGGHDVSVEPQKCSCGTEGCTANEDAPGCRYYAPPTHTLVPLAELEALRAKAPDRLRKYMSECRVEANGDVLHWTDEGHYNYRTSDAANLLAMLKSLS